MSATHTEKLNIIKVQPTDYFISDTFNNILDDIDSKVLGIDHLQTALHWTEWEENTTYIANDVVRWPNMKSHQYAKCITGGTSGGIEPGNNVTGSVLTEGSVTWKVMSLTEATDNSAPIMIWLGGEIYSRGDIVIYANALYRAKVNHTASGTFEPDKSKWQEIYASIRPWVLNKFYYEDDTVIVNNVIYKCNADHTSASTFTNAGEVPYWDIVGNLARASEWHSVTNYLKDQLITKNGLLYRAVETHTSSGVFTDDTLKWEPVFASIIPWTSNAWYDQDVVVYYNNVLYKCIDPHVSGANFDYLKWQLLHDPNGYVRDWVGSTHYYQNQLVRHNGNLYRCNTTNNDASFTIAKWDLLTDSINDWVGSRDYVVGQYVNYNGILYKCITANNDTNFTISNWQKVSGGGLDQWEQNTDYIVGDVVVYANKIYQCTTAHTSGATFNADSDKWNEISACITRIPNWEANKDYVIGDLVSHDAKIFRCTTPHTSESTWDATEELNWEELSPTINEISTWTPSTDYEIGQLVIHDNKLYRCNTDHTSDSTSFNTDIAYWDAIGSTGIDIWRANEAYTTSNVVIYNNKIYKCNTAHTSGSTFDPTKWDEISSADIGLWQSSTDYKVGNVVIKDNQIYRCKTLHTSDSSDFYTDIANWDILDTKWQVKDWVINTYYLEGEVVLYNNTPYKCTTAHTSLGTFELDKADWEPLSANIRQWVSGTTYKVGDTVIYEDQLYICTVANNDIAFERAKWRQVNKCSIEMWRGAPDPNVLALLHFDNPNDKGYNEYGDNFGISDNPALGEGKFGSGIDLCGRYGNISSPQYSFQNDEVYTIEFWIVATDRGFSENAHVSIGNIGGVITFPMYQGLKVFYSSPYEFVPTNFVGGVWNHMAFVISPTKCTTFINGKKESTSTRADSLPIYLSMGDRHSQRDHGVFGIDELLITKGEKYIDDFDIPTEPFQNPNYEGYKKDDLVVYEDKIYIALEDNNDVQFDKSKWVEVSSANIQLWETDTYYVVGNNVIYDNQTYRCITAHTSGTFLGDISKWQVLDTNWLVKDWAVDKLYLKDQVVSYRDGLWKSLITHESIADEPPTDAKIYEASDNVIDVDDTITLPYSEIIDLGSVKHITDIDYTESTSEMSFTYTIETSIDNITYENWTEDAVNAKYIKLTVDSVNIDVGAVSPNAHLTDFTVYGDSDKWIKISSGGSGDLIYATNSDIDNLFN